MAREWLAIVVTLAIAGCGGTAPAPNPTAQPTSGATANPTDVAPTGAVASGTPTGTAHPTQGVDETPGPTGDAPLPEPTLTDPADIGAALMDFNTVTEGVVSLVAAMGIAIVDGNGTVVRSGADRGAGELALTESEVRGLIADQGEDLTQLGEHGGPVPIADMYAALQPSLPAGFSLDDFVSAYADAYAAAPESLAAQVMRGQALDAQAGVMRIQMWLLLIDGFVGPESVGAALPAENLGPGSIAVLPAGHTLGTARQNLPGLTPVTPNISPADWAWLMAKLPTLADTIPFEVVSAPSNIHEGHGGPGAPLSFFAAVGVAAPLVAGAGGNTVLAVAPQPGLPVRWQSDDELVWQDHGSFDQQLSVPILIDPGSLSGAGITYTPGEETSNGAGTEVKELAGLFARADKVELIQHSYDASALGPALFLARGRVDASGSGIYPIRWHELGDGYIVRIEFTDVFDGIPDKVIFTGRVATREGGEPGAGNAIFTGIGHSNGSRPGWTRCNPGIDVVPSGRGKAYFSAVVQGDNVTITAFADGPLAGVSTRPLNVPVEGGYDDVSGFDVNPSEICPHTYHATIWAEPFGTP